MAELYLARTPRGVVERLEALDLVGMPAVRPTGDAGAGSERLSRQQRRYRNVYLPSENRSWCNMPALFPLPAGTGADAVRDALETLVRRHDALRASFPGPGHVDRQVFLPAADVTVRVDVVEVPAVGAAATQHARWVEEAKRPIDVTTWPLFRATLLMGEDGTRTLLWNVHHLVSDGHSQQVLRRELVALLEGREDDLRALPVSYRDYVRWCEATDDHPARARAAAHWRAVFAEPYRRTLLPVADPSADPAQGRAFQRPLPEELDARLDEFARRNGLTVFSVLLAAYVLSLHAHWRMEDVVVGTPAAGRVRPEVQDLVGNFISLVGIRHRAGEESTFVATARTLQARTAAAMDNQEYQYDEVMRDVGTPQDDDRFPLTTTFVSLVQLGDADKASVVAPPAHRDLGLGVKFDCMVYFRRAAGRTAVDVHGRQALLTAAMVEGLAGKIVELLEAGTADPSTDVTRSG